MSLESEAIAAFTEAEHANLMGATVKVGAVTCAGILGPERRENEFSEVGTRETRVRDLVVRKALLTTQPADRAEVEAGGRSYVIAAIDSDEIHYMLRLEARA